MSGDIIREALEYAAASAERQNWFARDNVSDGLRKAHWARKEQAEAAISAYEVLQQELTAMHEALALSRAKLWEAE